MFVPPANHWYDCVVLFSIGIQRGVIRKGWFPLKGKTIDDIVTRGELEVELVFISEQRESGAATFAVPEKKLAPRQSAILPHQSATTPRGSAIVTSGLPNVANGHSRASSSSSGANDGPSPSTSRISASQHPPSSPRGSGSASSIPIPPGLTLPPGTNIFVSSNAST
jgi:hypothetical protein